MFASATETVVKTKSKTLSQVMKHKKPSKSSSEEDLSNEEQPGIFKYSETNIKIMQGL